MMIAHGAGPMTSNALHSQDIHPTDLSPRSSLGSGSSTSRTTSPSPNSKDNLNGSQQLLHALNRRTPQLITEDLSPLQRLQFAFERTTILPNIFNGHEISNAITEQETFERSTPSPRSVQNSSQDPTLTHLGIKGMDLAPPSQESPNSDPANIFQCPLCSIVCNGRHSFNEHLVTHTQHHACPKCDYLTTSEDKLQDHLQRTHNLSEPVQAIEEDDTSTPKMNAQGKLKKFKCKQCDHVSLTKNESWTHSAVHIRPEKILKCPLCLFVTEYKHHLEYHIRQHKGSKPYQCDVCAYKCVNKSMLNSHLKSHSGVYQYNCLDCDYQTKYCHSLKMHLRKLNHRPSVVLNPDGTPNPLPIIDVYGTRRGPKLKKSQPSTTTPPVSQKHSIGYHSPVSSNHSNNSSNGSYSSTDEISSPKVKIEPGQMSSEMRESNHVTSPPPLKRSFSGNEDTVNDRKIIQTNPLSPAEFYRHLEPALESMPREVLNMGSKNPLEIYAVALNQYLRANPLLFTPAAPEQLARMAKEQENLMAHFTKQQQGAHLQKSHSQELELRSYNMSQVALNPSFGAGNQTPLDLRNPKTESERRRRKGKAFKYERQALEVPGRNEEAEALDFSNNNYKMQGQREKCQRTSGGQSPNYSAHHGGSQFPLMCKYCEISFPDDILYRMHMNYHSGDNDPFVCRPCGKKTQDKVAFFLHLTTDSH